MLFSSLILPHTFTVKMATPMAAETLEHLQNSTLFIPESRNYTLQIQPRIPRFFFVRLEEEVAGN
jgi:hypothetical protein